MNLTTNSTFFSDNDDDDDRDFSHQLAIIQGAIYIPIFLAGLVNNLLTILIILLNRDMHTITNCYLLNLAISDSLPLIVSLPFEITFLPINLPCGQIGCKLRSLLAETSTNTSILTISAFTIERYIAVCRPLHTSILTTGRAIKILILIWFIAILSSSPYFYMTVRDGHHCYFDPNYQFFVKICFYISATCFFVLPVSMLCVLYALMGRRLYSAAGVFNQFRQSKPSAPNSYTSPSMCLEQMTRTTRRHSSSTSVLTGYASIQRSAKTSLATLSVQIQSMKKSAFKMLFAVVIAFIICYAPFHVQRLIASSSNAHYLTLIQRRLVTIFYFISGILYYLGSTINPIFYHLFSKKYRQAWLCTMKRIVHCQRNRTKNFYLYKTAAKQTRLVLYGNMSPTTQMKTKSVETTIYRVPMKHKASVDLNSNAQQLLRYSLPSLNTERRKL